MPPLFKCLPLSLVSVAILLSLPNCATAAPQLNCAEARKEIDSDSGSKGWESVYSSFKRFADCEGESNKIAQGHGASIGRLLVEHWDEWMSLSRLVSADNGFEQYVLRHMADLRNEQLKTIARNANQACQSGEERLCRLLESRADELLVERKDPSAEELSVPECNLHQVDRWVGRAAIRRGSKDAIDITLPCLLLLWRDDKGGSTKFVVSDAFLSLMEQNPSEFFSLMAKEPKIFAQWVGDMDNLSFTWPNDPPCQLETTRKHLISILQHSETPPGRQSSLKEAVVTKLTATRCRQIN
jgi:hypothetical protein